MRAWLIWGVAVAAALVVGLALAVSGSLPEVPVPWGRSEPPLVVSFRPLASPDEAPRAPAEGGDDERSSALADPAPPLTENPERAQATMARVRARLVDPAGNGLGEGFLRVATQAGPKQGANSDPGGRVTLELELLEGEKGATLEAGASGFASRSEIVRLAPDAVVDLGTLVLEPGGAVRGHVLDESGHGIAGAVVTRGAADKRPQELEVRRILRAMPARTDEIDVPLVVTGHDGGFVLDGLEEGLTRLWARATGRVPTFTAPIEVRAGQESYGVRIVLSTLASDQRIAGVVLEPGGAAVPFAPLEFGFQSSDLRLSYKSQREADEAGRFEFMLPADATLSITARDPQDRFGPASAEEVATGEGELVLRLQAGPTVRLVVLGSDGAALETFDFEIVPASFSGDGTLPALQRGASSPGETPASFRLPESEFLVRVTARLHHRGTVGPLAPAAVGESLEVLLDAAPALAGVVQSAAGPVAGARVSLHARVPDDKRVERNGFRCRVSPWTADEAVTDGQGGFQLTVRACDSYVVRAEKEGYAPAEVGPLELDPDRVVAPVELHLGPGGAIAGRLLAPLGEDPTGRVVAVDRGDGHAQRRRVDPDGAYFFGQLTPGPWRVEALDEELLHTVTSSSPAARSFEREVEWSCTVVEGETTRFDLVQVDAEAFLLAGRVELEGVDPGQLIAWLCPSDLPLVECFDNPDRWPKTSVDSQGRFELGAPEPGGWRLVVKRASVEAEWVLTNEVRLVGPRTEWELALGTGTVVLADLPTSEPSSEMPPFVYWWGDDSGHLYLRLVVPDASGTCRLDHVPTGAARLLRPSMEDMLEPERWPVALTLEVTRGEETRVAVP